MSIVDNVKHRIEEARERWPLLDHLVRMVEHYGKVAGNEHAAAVTYFAFLSFFPIMALSFAVIGQVSKAYPNAESDLVEAINQVLPGIVGSGENQVDLASIQDSAPGIFSVGLILALYSGLGWLSGMRQALMAVFEEPAGEKPNFFLGKARDILGLLVLGSVLIVSVAVSGVATKLVEPILEFLGLGAGAGVVLWLVALALGLAANTLLFFAFFKLLASSNDPNRSLWSGAVLGALGFEVLKQASTFLLKSTAEQPAFQAFGIALILIVWMNYFSRIIVFAASWAHTSPAAREKREREQTLEHTVKGPQIDLTQAARVAVETGTVTPPARLARGSFAAGAAAMLAVVAAVRRRG